MDKVLVKMFGIPEIKKNGTIIKFPFKKAEALFYYLLIKKRTTRDELIGLFWSDVNEVSARGNLRNGLYVIRKAFNMDIIRPDQSQIICVEKDVKVIIDVDVFVNGEDTVENYKGEFLKGLFIKDCEEYEQWLLNQRQYYSKIYRDRLYKKLEDSFDNKNEEAQKGYCKLLINSDKFDEKPYKLLMEIYSNNRQFNKAIALYQNLEEILNKELDITPNTETKKEYKRIMKLKEIEEENIKEVSKKFFYGREKELNLLLKNFYSFVKNELYNYVLITGEAGIGKTGLIERFLNYIDVSEFYLFKVDCYYV